LSITTQGAAPAEFNTGWRRINRTIYFVVQYVSDDVAENINYRRINLSAHFLYVFLFVYAPQVLTALFYANFLNSVERLNSPVYSAPSYTSSSALPLLGDRLLGRSEAADESSHNRGTGEAGNGCRRDDDIGALLIYGGVNYRRTHLVAQCMACGRAL